MSRQPTSSIGIRWAAGIVLVAIGIITIVLLFLLGVVEPRGGESTAPPPTQTVTVPAPTATPPPPTATPTPAPPTNTPTLEKPRGSGETIIYVCKNGWDPETLCIADANDAISMDLAGLTGPNSEPEWSPDGTRILFASYRNERGDLYVINADGTGLRNVSQNRAWSSVPIVWTQFSKATWSPDGRRIAFPSMETMPVTLRLMDIDSGSTTVLPVPAGTIYCMQPDWSPDGALLAAVCPTSESGIHIWLLPSSVGQAQRISPLDMWALHPAWSPDGQYIAFTGKLTNAGESDPGGIYVMLRDGSSLRRVVGNGMLPAWSPDGTRLVFERNKRLYTIKVDGTEEQPLRVTVSGGTMPNWAKVAFWDVGGAFMDLYRKQKEEGKDAWAALPTPVSLPSPTPTPSSTPLPPNPRPVCADPRACITSPRVGDAVTGVMPLMGSTNLPDFQYFKVEYRPYGEQNWRWLMDGKQSVANGKIMDWHSYTVPKGVYEIRLTVIKKDGNYPEPCITRVRIY